MSALVIFSASASVLPTTSSVSADDEAMAQMKRSYETIVTCAEAYDVTVNIEVHGYFTTNPDRMAEMLAFCDSPNLRMNFDSGNTFIAGRDPVAFCRRFLDKISHMHVKDVSESLAQAVRGEQTGIADCGYNGVLSMECEGAGGPMIERSLAWLRRTLNELGIREKKS